MAYKVQNTFAATSYICARTVNIIVLIFVSCLFLILEISSMLVFLLGTTCSLKMSRQNDGFCFQFTSWSVFSKKDKRNSTIPKGQTEIAKSEDRHFHAQQNLTKNKHRIHNTTLKTKARVTHI